MTTSTADSIAAAALALREARAQRKTIARISETYAIAGVADAYAVARINTQNDIAGGRKISGKKIGLTSRAVQQQLGVDQPDYGVLFSDMEYRDMDAIDTNRLLQPKAEGEVAFVMGRDLDATDLTWGRFLLGIEYLLPAIEIVDSAITDWKITLVDTVADNASCGLYVLGTEPKRLGDVDLQTCGMELQLNGTTASVGSGAACLGHPLKAAYWLATTMARLGQPLRAGDVVLSGALGPMVPIQYSDVLALQIAGLGQVRCHID